MGKTPPSSIREANPSKQPRHDLLDRISTDPAICHGRPCIRGLRYPVDMILELLSSGMTSEEILADYSDLEREDVLAGARVCRTSEPSQESAGAGFMKFLKVC